MRTAICMIGVALFAAMAPPQVFSQDKETSPAESIFQPHHGRSLYSMAQGARHWGSGSPSDNTWRPNTGNQSSRQPWRPHAVIQSSRQETFDDYYKGRMRQYGESSFPLKPNAPECLAPHNDRSFSWSMVMRDPQPGRGGWRDWQPGYYRDWQRMDANCQ